MTNKGENIYKRKDGRWEGRYIKSRNGSGKIIYGSVYGKKYSEVKDKLVMIKAKHFEGNSKRIQPYSGTFQDWIQYWMSTEVRNNVKITTYSAYSRLIDKHIIPILGERIVSKIQIKDLQNFIYDLQDKGLSAGSIKNIFNIVNMCMKSAKRYGYVSENLCAYAILPKLERKEIEVLTREQQQKLERVAIQESTCSPVILSLYSGMRIGEISGLKWEDIDFESDLIYVKRTISRIIDENSAIKKTKLIEGPPKTSCSIRKIPLARNLRDYLLEKKQNSTSEYVIENENGVTEPRTITNRLKKNLEESELDHINFHLLRHTFATRCLEKNVDIASLSKILGHQSIKMTLDTYANSLMETRRIAISKLDDLFSNIK